LFVADCDFFPGDLPFDKPLTKIKNIKTSSKTNTNIREAFDELLKLDSKSGLSSGVDYPENMSSSTSLTKNSNSGSKKNNKKKCSLM
jgi:hypothetical protein